MKEDSDRYTAYMSCQEGDNAAAHQLEVEKKKAFIWTIGYLPVYNAPEQCCGYIAVRCRWLVLLPWLLGLLGLLCAVALLTLSLTGHPLPDQPAGPGDGGTATIENEVPPAPTGSDTLKEGLASQTTYEEELKRLQDLTDASKVKISINAGPSCDSNGQYNVLIENAEKNITACI